jgi:pyruvate/2-oxoglutarate dehydrogenase complex dihydrolipoamide dehydrogenase (E3) component
MATRYDAIIIGTGQTGPLLAVRLAGAGMKVAIVERKRFGGNLCQQWLHPDEDAGRKRPHGSRRAE